jgi:hypothetical protein
MRTLLVKLFTYTYISFQTILSRSLTLRSDYSSLNTPCRPCSALSRKHRPKFQGLRRSISPEKMQASNAWCHPCSIAFLGRGDGAQSPKIASRFRKRSRLIIVSCHVARVEREEGGSSTSKACSSKCQAANSRAQSRSQLPPLKNPFKVAMSPTIINFQVCGNSEVSRGGFASHCPSSAANEMTPGKRGDTASHVIVRQNRDMLSHRVCSLWSVLCMFRSSHDCGRLLPVENCRRMWWSSLAADATA